MIGCNKVCEELGVSRTVPSPVSTCKLLFYHQEPLLISSGQVIMSIRCKDVNRPVIMEALRRARYKFPGRQKIIVSKKWGFTSLNRADYEALKRDKLVINDGAYVQVSLKLRICRTITYVQFLKPKGKLLQNLRTAQRATSGVKEIW